MICLLPAASGEGELNRASTATIKPKAAGSAACVAGTISCNAPETSPPFGKWQSRAASPKASPKDWAVCKVWGEPVCRDSKRRNSVRTAARPWVGGRDENADGTSIYKFFSAVEYVDIP